MQITFVNIVQMLANLDNAQLAKIIKNALECVLQHILNYQILLVFLL